MRTGWRYVGGGCLLSSRAPICDMEFRHSRTGREVVLQPLTNEERDAIERIVLRRKGPLPHPRALLRRVRRRRR